MSKRVSILFFSFFAAFIFLLLLLSSLTSFPAVYAQSALKKLAVNQAKPHVAVVSVDWDDADSHKWLGAGWGGADTPSSLTWAQFHGRNSLEVRWDYPAWLGYVHTDKFLEENWELPLLGLRADVYVESSQSWTDIGIEPQDQDFNSIELIWGDAINLGPNQWHSVTWYFTEAENYQQVTGLIFKFDQLGNYPAHVYLDNIRLITANDELEWDNMNDESRYWFYGGNWFNWSGRTSGLEAISHNGENPTTPGGSVYLQWDYLHGVSMTLTSAEVGTNWLDDNRDWRNFNRIAADVKVSDAHAPISVFLWDEETQTGFGTPIRRATAANEWQRLTWDFPWPPEFDASEIDEIKFVVNGIDVYTTGVLFLDNISLFSDTLPPPVSGLAYVFEDFNDRNPFFNDFNGNWGELSGDYITTTFASEVTRGASLKVDYSLPGASYTGLWHSLWGHSDYTETRCLDFTDVYGNLNGPDKDFEQIQFWVRGSGLTTATHNVKIELKDNNNDYKRTAYRYIRIDDADTTWRQIVLDTDITNGNGDFWAYNLEPPDPTCMKQMVFVIESYFNNPTGTFYIDDIRFVDADDIPFDLAVHTDEEFLDFVSEKSFLYFLDWYDPYTGLFQDRSTFPDLMSTAATGFGLTALTIGESRGWISHTLAVEMISRTLATLRDGQTVTDTLSDTISQTNGYKGFYYHFLGTDGLRKDVGSELSPVDTALLLAGVLTVREHFSDTATLVDLADDLYRRVEWDWMVDPDTDLFYLAWKPVCDAVYGIPAPGGGCFSNYRWDYYTDEAILINLLAIGAPIHSVPADVFYAWARTSGAYGGQMLFHSWNGSFFTYVFAHLWVDFAALGADRHPTSTLRVDWWDNSTAAAQANWQYAVDHQDDVTCDGDGNFTTYGPASWGLTAADGPNELAHGTWANSTPDSRALQDPDTPNGPRRAVMNYSNTGFEIDINVTDTLTHTLSFYVLDWDGTNRQETIQVLDPVNGAPVASSGVITDFGGGVYARFAFQGSVKVILNRYGVTNVVSNTVLSGVFFDAGTGTTGFLGLDTNTQGNWIGSYGSDGYVLLNWSGDGRKRAQLPDYVTGISFRGGYHAYGAAPVDPRTIADHDGVIAPYGAGMGIMFLRNEGVLALQNYFINTDLWRYRFGFGDAYSLDPPDCGDPWYNHAAFGIDQGPLLLAIENARSGFLWQTMARSHNVSLALCAVWCQEEIGGLTTGIVNQPYAFTAHISPVITAAQPITFVWQASGLTETMTQTDGFSSTAIFQWSTAGAKVITVTAATDLSIFTATHVVTINIPLSGLLIAAPAVGIVETDVTFTATVYPISVTQPITYFWQASEYVDIQPQVDGLTSSLLLTWDTPGVKVITVTAVNVANLVTQTHHITIQVPVASVAITGPTTGVIDTNYVFTASIQPLTATLPVTYIWTVTGDFLPVTYTNGLSDTASFAWHEAGTQTVTVTALNATGMASSVQTITIYVRPTGVRVTGPVTGAVNTGYLFEAAVSPPTTTTPITYIWQAGGQPDVITHTSGVSDTILFTWTAPGAQMVTVTAVVANHVVTDTRLITIYVLPTEVNIQGPTTGFLHADYTFTATVAPISTTRPITYIWQVTGYDEPITQQGGISDSITLHWEETGIQTITVTVKTAGGMITGVPYQIVVAREYSVYLPTILHLDSGS